MCTHFHVWLGPAGLAALALTFATTVSAFDPGINQPGAVGNVHRDFGVNQPGAAGNVGMPRVGVDPGVNQPGLAGNVRAPRVGRDPGVNQPGLAGNRRRPYR
jgi:hypothetical protein